VTRTGDIAGNAGYSNLTGIDNNKHVNFGFSGGANLTHRVTVLAEYNYLPMGSLNAPDGASASGDYQQIGGAARFNLFSSKRVVPYAVVGYGYARQSRKINGGSTSLNGDYVNGGGGANFYLGRNWGVRPEFRYERQEFYAQGQSAGQNVAWGTAGIFYQFRPWGGK
jgi:hypothetical protein